MVGFRGLMVASGHVHLFPLVEAVWFLSAYISYVLFFTLA